MNDDGVVRHRFGIVLTQTFDETRRGPDQHQTLRWPAGIGQPPGHARLAIGTEGKTGQHDGNVATPQLCVMQYGQQIFRFAPALVVRPLGRTDAPEIWPESGITQSNKGLGQCMCDLVGIGAPAKRVRMRHQSNTARRIRALHQDFDITDRAGNREFFFVNFHTFRRSTTRPCTRCSCTISSISSLST